MRLYNNGFFRSFVETDITRSWTLRYLLDNKRFDMYNFTQNDLLLYFYNETTPEMTLAIENALKVDFQLEAELKQIRETYQQVAIELESPRTETILHVLRYARETMPASI